MLLSAATSHFLNSLLSYQPDKFRSFQTLVIQFGNLHIGNHCGGRRWRFSALREKLSSYYLKSVLYGRKVQLYSHNLNVRMAHATSQKAAR